MILRKPYAFLIKYFKIIHLVIAVSLIYLGIETIGIVTFFNDYVSTGSFTYSNNLGGQYIDFFMYVDVVLIIALNITIFLLMRQKEKPTKLYTANIIYYIFVFILLSISFWMLDTVQKEIVSLQTIRLFRDITLFGFLPQVFFIFYSIFRGIGFDVKKFNFASDKEFKAEEKDREEVEIVVGKNNYKIKRTIRRFIREFKYYIKENTFIFIIILSVLIIIIGTLLFFNRSANVSTYRENNNFKYKNYEMKLLDSVLTPYNYNGDIISKDKYYLVVKFDITNIAFDDKITTNDFRLMLGEEKVFPTYTKNSEFIDLGKPYYNQTLITRESEEYLLIYEVPIEEVKNNYTLRIVESIGENNGQLQPTYRELKINPDKQDEIINMGEYALTEEISFEDTVLNESTLKVNEVLVTDNYTYKYDYCSTADNCYESTGSLTPPTDTTLSKTLVVLQENLKLVDSDFLENKIGDRYFFDYFMELEYTWAGKEKLTDVKNYTPNQLEDTTVLSAYSDIKYNDKLDIVITIRNKQYTINVK